MKRKVKYEKVKQGQPVTIPIRNKQGAWAIKCCDCGLEHVVLFNAERRKNLIASVWRMDDINAAQTPKDHYVEKKNGR